MDNYYLNNAVYLTEAFLESANPPYKGVVDYGDRAEHCWNGDHESSNAVSRLRYNTFYVPRILERIEATAPKGDRDLYQRDQPSGPDEDVRKLRAKSGLQDRERAKTRRSSP